MNISAFNWADYTILAVIGLSIFISLIRGFIREAFSLATWVLAFWVGLSFSPSLAPSLANYISHENLRVIAAFAILFVITLILGTLVSVLISQIVRKTGLSGTDRLLGVLFGAARGGLLVALLILTAGLFAAGKEVWWQKSILIPKMMPMASWLKDYLPENIKVAFDNNGKEKPKWANLIPDGSVFKNPLDQATGNTEANDNPLMANSSDKNAPNPVKLSKSDSQNQEESTTIKLDMPNKKVL